MLLKAKAKKYAARSAVESAGKKAVETVTHPTKSMVKSLLGFLLCGLAVFVVIKMTPEAIRYARIKRM